VNTIRSRLEHRGRVGLSFEPTSIPYDARNAGRDRSGDSDPHGRRKSELVLAAGV
jgi:hypothetical protein